MCPGGDGNVYRCQECAGLWHRGCIGDQERAILRRYFTFTCPSCATYRDARKQHATSTPTTHSMSYPQTLPDSRTHVFTTPVIPCPELPVSKPPPAQISPPLIDVSVPNQITEQDPSPHGSLPFVGNTPLVPTPLVKPIPSPLVDLTRPDLTTHSHGSLRFVDKTPLVPTPAPPTPTKRRTSLTGSLQSAPLPATRRLSTTSPDAGTTSPPPAAAAAAARRPPTRHRHSIRCLHGLTRHRRFVDATTPRQHTPQATSVTKTRAAQPSAHPTPAAKHRPVGEAEPGRAEHRPRLLPARTLAAADPEPLPPPAARDSWWVATSSLAMKPSSH
ncbi:uncharacterized protein LOC134534390 [Bacillus rossius redtenbacheri]|uniref:uncharacterized protein LOC134534390 n=1 Tax=Bacillus rossius redtenbacheri TaxID=93214 RepID=UPI002FDECC97